MAQQKSHSSPVDPAHSHETIAAEHADDLVVVPKGQSRFQFFLILGLFIFILVIFTVGPFFQQTMGGLFSGGTSRDRVYFSWHHPGSGEKHEYSTTQFYTEKRSLEALRYLGFYASVHMRDGVEGRDEVTDEETAMWLILDQVATDKGFAVTREEVRQRVEAWFEQQQMVYRSMGRPFEFTDWHEYYGAVLRGNNLSSATIEHDLERLVRSELYAQFLKGAVALPDPTSIEKAWSEDPNNEEYAFDYVELAATDTEGEARDLVPDDQGLVDWLHTQPEQVQKEFRTDDRLRIEVAWLPLKDLPEPTLLLEKYPVPANWVPEDEARRYYTMHSNQRFKIPEDEQQKPDEQSGDEENPPKPPQLYRTFDEVREQCAQEAAWKRALDAWLTDMYNRAEAGEQVDFQAECENFGMAFEGSGEALSRDQMEKANGWGGPLAAGALFYAQPGRFMRVVQVEPGAMVLGRNMLKEAGVERPIDEIREKLTEKWVENKKIELAMKHLESLRDGFGTRPPEGGEEPYLPVVDRATFVQAVEAKGWKVVERPYLRRYELPNDDYDAATAADQLIRVSQVYFDLTEGQVPAAEQNSAKTHAVLVRAAGTRTAPLERMKPADLDRLRRTGMQDTVTEYEKRYLRADSPEVRSKYAIFLYPTDGKPAEAEQ